MRQLKGTELKRLHRERRRQARGEVTLLLDAVQTPYNVGTIIRLAAAFRVDHLYLAAGTASPHHPGSNKTALGSQRFVTWSEHEEVAGAADAAKADGYRLVGIDLVESAVPIDEVELPEQVCLAFGHEDRGLSTSCLMRCDAVAYIPQLGKIGSLNVASAAAIAIYEARRRHWHD